MQETHDYLGIERLLDKTLSEIEAYQPSPDDYQRWNDHPITIRMKKQLAVDLYQHLIDSPAHNLDYCAMLRGILSYGIEGKSND